MAVLPRLERGRGLPLPEWLPLRRECGILQRVRSAAKIIERVHACLDWLSQ